MALDGLRLIYSLYLGAIYIILATIHRGKTEWVRAGRCERVIGGSLGDLGSLSARALQWHDCVGWLVVLVLRRSQLNKFTPTSFGVEIFSTQTPKPQTYEILDSHVCNVLSLGFQLMNYNRVSVN